jgi:hypothetical protein
MMRCGWLRRKDGSNRIFVAFGRFIVQRLQAIWLGVHFHCGAVRNASKAVAEESRLDAGSHSGGIRHRPQLHLRHGAREEERLSTHDRGSRAGLWDFSGAACQGARP